MPQNTNSFYPMLSVRLMTFNHADFIRDAMKSIMMQVTNFPVEVVIGDDFSTDDTLKIAQEFENTSNIQIRILDRKIGDPYWKKRQEFGRLYNFYDILQNCRGKYIALLDGDDYWTDSKKLQKQVDFLEENLDYIASFHKVKVVNKDGDTVKENKFSKTSLHDFSSEMLIKGRVIPVLAWCFRNVVKDIPPEFLHSGLGDKFLSSFLGNYGKAKFQHEVEPSAYRVGEHGMWSQKDVLSKKRLNLMTVYQLWRYYDRIGKKNIANSMFKNLCIQGYKLYPLTTSLNFIDKIEKIILKSIYKLFSIMRMPIFIYNNKLRKK